MISISKALFATIQRVREYYQLTDPDNQTEVAMPPEWVNSAPLIMHLQDKSEWSPQEKLENEYELAQFANSIVTNKFAWNADGAVLWEVFQQLLDSTNSEISEDILMPWTEARNSLETNFVKTTIEEIDFYTTYMDDDPNWQTISIAGDQFEELYESAQSDEAFARMYEFMKGGKLDDLLDIRALRFEMAFVSIERPWFREELLENRQWRLRHGGTINGKTFLSSDTESEAFKGALPGYPVAFILIRNFEVTMEVAAENEDKREKEKMDDGQTFNFGPLFLNGNLYNLLQGQMKVLNAEGVTASLKSINQLKYNFKLNILPQDQRKFILQNEVKFKDLPKAPLQGMKVQGKPLSPGPIKLPGFQGFSGKAGKVSFEASAGTGRGKTTISTTSVTVNVTDDTGKPLSGAEVVFRQIGEENDLSSLLVFTGQQGKAFVFLSTDQSYKVLIKKEAHQSFETSIRTKAGEPTNLQAKIRASKKVEKMEKVTDIQLLAVVYKKLGKVPNPVEEFEPINGFGI